MKNTLNWIRPACHFSALLLLALMTLFTACSTDSLSDLPEPQKPYVAGERNVDHGGVLIFSHEYYMKVGVFEACNPLCCALLEEGWKFQAIATPYNGEIELIALGHEIDLGYWREIRRSSSKGVEKTWLFPGDLQAGEEEGVFWVEALTECHVLFQVYGYPPDKLSTRPLPDEH